MKLYTIRIETKGNLFTDYTIKARNIIQAKIKALNFFKANYPNAKFPKKIILTEPSVKVMTQINKIIEKEKKSGR